jgi:pyrroline-5-carboxylate reductase
MDEPEAPRFPASLVLAGAGAMGGAMLRAWLNRGLAPGAITVIDPDPAQDIATLAAESAFALNQPAAEPEVLVLAIKPQVLDAATPLAALAGPRTLVISILAGKTISDIRARFPAAKAIIRAMPNLPAAVGRGIAGLVAEAGAEAAERAVAEALMAATGAAVWLDDERLIDAVTAISGSGPAYVFYLAECLAEAGAALGLPADVAARLARATIEGAGELLFQNRCRTPAELREAVTSRGGTTAAALDVLMGDDGLAPLIGRAAHAAHRRAGTLSG